MNYDDEDNFEADTDEGQGIYEKDTLEDLEENDEISPEEEAFMEGYRKAGIVKEKNKGVKPAKKEEEKSEKKSSEKQRKIRIRKKAKKYRKKKR